MIKKISAVVLALVLCLSVIVVPASAVKAELGSGKMAFALEWDKASYSAGDTAYLSVYMNAEEATPLFTGSFLIGLNSSVFTQADNPIATVKANATTSDLFASYWKDAATNLSWLASTVVTRVQGANTEAENALFDQYLKFTAAKNIAGSHANAGNNKDGFYGSEFTDEPIMTIALKVAADIPDGTAVNAAITSGSTTCSPAQTAWKYYSNPGNATTAANIAAADFNIANATATATVGEVASSIVKFSKAQIRFQGIGADKDKTNYKNAFDVRTVAAISQADFNATFTDEANAKAKITDFGFVYAAKSNVADFSVDTAKAVAEGGSAENYVKKSVTYMQHAGDGADYIFTCLIENIDDIDETKADGVNCLAYVCFDGTYYYFDAAASVDFGALYNTHFPA